MLMKHIEELKKENEELRRVLGFYGDERNWVIWNAMAVSTTDIERDKGIKARKALGWDE